MLQVYELRAKSVVNSGGELGCSARAREVCRAPTMPGRPSTRASYLRVATKPQGHDKHHTASLPPAPPGVEHSPYCPSAHPNDAPLRPRPRRCPIRRRACSPIASSRHVAAITTIILCKPESSINQPLPRLCWTTARAASEPAPCPCDRRAPARPLPRQTQTRNLQRFRVCPLALQLVQRRRPDKAPARRRRLDARPPRASQTQQYTTRTQSHGAHKERHLQLRAFVPWCEAQS